MSAPAPPRPGTGGPATGEPRRAGGPLPTVHSGAPGRTSGRPHADWLGAGAMALAVLFAAGSLSGVFQGTRWLEHSTVTICAVLAVCAVVRSFRTPSPWPSLAGLAALVPVLTLQFFAGSAILGFIPDADTVQRAVSAFPQANRDVLSQTVPVEAGEPLMFITCLALGLVAVCVDLIVYGLRFPAFSAVPLAVVLSASSLVKPSGAGLLHVAATGVGFLLVLGAERLSASAQRPGAALRTGLARQGVAIAAGAIAAMLVVPLAVPGFTTGLLPEGRKLYLWGQPTGINPVLSLGNNLRSPLGLTSIEYYTDSEQPLYLRTAVVGDLDARRWAPSDDDVAREPVGSFLRGNVSTRAVAGGTETTTLISTGNYQSPWLPLPRNPRGVEGLRGDWGWFPTTATILSGGGSSLGQRYEVASVVPAITPELLASGRDGARRGRSAEVPSEYTSFPDNLPPIIGDTALEVVREAGASNNYETALALQNHLRGPGYAYSEETPLEQGYDGDGLAVVQAFLEQRSGYCIHYSSAMALMARTLGIPSRIAVGYAPGRPNGSSVPGPNGTELQGYGLTSRSAHAWPELFFPGIGWVPFEPTPGRGSTPSYAPDPLAGSGEPTAEPEAQPVSETAPAPSATAQPPQDEPGAGGPATGTTDGGPTGVLFLAGGGLLLLAGPHLLRRIIRRGRIRRVLAAGEPGAGAAVRRAGPAAAWEEALALGRDYGLPMLPAETAASYAARLALRAPGAEPSLARLRAAYERVTYARPEAELVGAGVSAGPTGSAPRAPAALAGWEPASEAKLAGREPASEAELLAGALGDLEMELSAAAAPFAQARARGLPASLFTRPGPRAP